MKLKTTMASKYNAEGVSMTAEGGFQDNLIAIEHDSACAHALMLAQDEFWKQDDLDSLDARDAVEMIGVRASEIMAEWGFDSAPEQPE